MTRALQAYVSEVGTRLVVALVASLLVLGGFWHAVYGLGLRGSAVGVAVAGIVVGAFLAGARRGAPSRRS